MSKSSIGAIDWLSILFFLFLLAFGWVNIYSTTYNPDTPAFFDLAQYSGKQFLWIGASLALIIVIISTDTRFFERFSSIIYLASLLLLVGLFPFGKTISGATSWYSIGSFTLQPSEFAKIGTALALSKYISDIQTDLKNLKSLGYIALIIAIPALLILAQPDAGSAMIFAAFLFPLHREGLTGYILFILFTIASLFILTLLFGVNWVVGSLFILGIIIYYFLKKQRGILLFLLGGFAAMSAYCYSVDFVFHNVFKQHHRDRFNIVLGKTKDTRGIGYNTNQSEIAIGNGRWFGKGWTEGSQTQGNFVPEQHTDYIFSAAGEEWGFIGSLAFIIAFLGLCLRVLHLAERQKSQFSRVYGYGVVSILFFHFLINIGMVIGLLPTVGIPLPFLSYGGSSLWAFTILLFVFLKMDADRNKR